MTVNHDVAGSSPAGGAIRLRGQAVKTPPFHGGNRGSIPLGVTRKNDLSKQVVFSVIFACGKLYCCAVIFGLRRVILCFAQFNGKYNITETEGFNITFVLTKISLQRSWNITKKFLHLYCSTLSKIDILRQRNVDFTYYLFTLHYSLKAHVDFWKVISNSE